MFRRLPAAFLLALVATFAIQGQRVDSTWYAVKDKPEATLKAIAELQIPYPQILDSQDGAYNLYGLNGIPHIILFAPDGTILARGLAGENIEQQLKKIFNNW